MGVLDNWINDLPQQFQGKEHIEGLIRAVSKQIEDLYVVCNQLDTETGLESAVGKNLDMVGDIMNLSRKAAHLIIRAAENDEVTDDRYRQVLRYKAISNSCDCTYNDIMTSINLLWDTENIKYVEPSDRPATVLLTMPTTNLDSIDPSVGRVLAIKPAGVAIIYTIGYWSEFLSMENKRIRLSRMILHWKFSFYSFTNGDVKRLDGTWPLDGSVLLSAFSLDAPVIIRYSGIKIRTNEHISMKHLCGFLTRNPGSAHARKCTMQTEIEEAKHQDEIDCHISMAYQDKNENDISAYLITKQNIWYLDGTFLLDGSRCLNAIEKKEVL